jgi:hypothetical protein
MHGADSELVWQTLQYIGQVFDCMDEQMIQSYVRQVASNKDETMASQYVRDLMDKGRKEGIKEGVEGVLFNLLHKRFGSVPGWVAERLHGANPQELARWCENMLTAQSLDDVFA